MAKKPIPKDFAGFEKFWAAKLKKQGGKATPKRKLLAKSVKRK